MTISGASSQCSIVTDDLENGGNVERRRRHCAQSEVDTRAHMRQIQSQIISLVMISTWTFLLNIPLDVLIFHLGMTHSSDPVETLFSPLGKFCTSAAMVASFGIPVLCVWRVVSKQILQLRMRECCCR